MYALKRIAAYVIDFVLIYTPIAAALGLGEEWLMERVPQRLHLIAITGGWGLSLFAPVLVVGTLTGLTGRTPGKLITFLRVHDAGDDPPGIPQGILREIIKIVSLGFFFGMIWALQGLVTHGRTFYDEWLDLEVEDLRPYGLTPTQKKFRKYMRDQARLKKG
jgi:uncharacterized RDD family membrane protein YckC